MIPAIVIAIVIVIGLVALTARRKKHRAELMGRLDRVVRILGANLGPDSELVDIRDAKLVVRIGEKTVRIGVLKAFEALEGVTAEEMRERVRWLVNNAELEEGKEKAE